MRHGGRPRRRSQDQVPKEQQATAEGALPVEIQQQLELAAAPAAEPEPAPAAEPATAAEAAAAVEVEPAAEAIGTPESTASAEAPAEAPAVEPPFELSRALALEFGRAIEASWASAEAEDAEPDAEPEPDEESEQAQEQDRVELQLRLARVHLRTGALGLARVELEKLAGLGPLDSPAMLDLAEVRWRTGDLAGAGIAATAYVAAGGGEAIGFVIAAEASSAADRPAEARRYAGRALERSHVSLETYFAGMPRRLTWPQEAGISEPPAPHIAASQAAPETVATRLPRRAATRPERDRFEAPVDRHAAPGVPAVPVAPPASVAPPVPVAPPPAVPAGVPAEPLPAVPAEPPSGPEAHTEAGAEVQAGVAALQFGDVLMAGLHFGLALRLTPSAAEAVLEAIDDLHDLPLELVRGDALRLLGRAGAADKAYLSVAAELRGPTPDAAESPPADAPDVAEAPEPAGAAPEPEAEQVTPEPEPTVTEPVPAPEPASAAAAPAAEPTAKAPPEPPAIRWE